MAPYVVGESGSIRDLQFAIWEVRFTVLVQLRHWKLRACDAWTVPVSDTVPADVQADRMIAFYGDTKTHFQA